MTSEKMHTKVRLVLCPKCRLLLPELSEISVYKCGGCSTVLQAKHSKLAMKEADHNNEVDDNKIKDADCVSDFTLSKKDASISAIDGASSPNTSRTDIISDNDMNTKQSQLKDSSLSPAQNEDSSPPEQKNPMERDEDNSFSKQDSGKFERILSNDFPISSELTFNEMEDSSSPDQKKRIEQDKDDSVLNPDSGNFEGILSIDFPISTELKYNEMEDCSIDLHQILGPENDTDQYTEADETKHAKMKRDYLESCNFSDDDCSVMLNSSPESKTHDEHKSSIKEGVLDLESKESPNVLADIDVSPNNHHLPVVESSTELSVKNPKDFKKSPTRSYYDGSVSSSDGMDDRVPNRSSKPPRRKIKHGPLKRAESELPSLLSSETDKLYHRRYNDDLMSSESEIQHLSRKATFLEAKNKDNMIRVPSNRYNEHDSSLPNKSELLKMINELKDDLNRTRISNLSFPARFAVEEKQHTWPYHHHHHHYQSPSTDALYAADFPQMPRFSRMAFSGEATNQTNCSCLTRDRYYSGGGLPLHGLCTYNHHQFLQEQETISKNIIRIPTEKDRSTKRYLRPEAGGIPVLSCYHCSELLHLPADFLLYGKKYHKLRCNKCQKIMNFSLENGTHIIPYTPNDTIAPPPSMVNDYNPNSRKHGVISSVDRSSSINSERLARLSHENLKHDNKMNKRNLTFDQMEMHTRRKNSMVTVGSSGRWNDLKEAPSTSEGGRGGGGSGVYRALHRLMGYSSPSQVIRR